MNDVADVGAHESRRVRDEVGPRVRLHGVADGEKADPLECRCRPCPAADVEDDVACGIAIAPERDPAGFRMTLESGKGEALWRVMDDTHATVLPWNDRDVDQGVTPDARLGHELHQRR